MGLHLSINYLYYSLKLCAHLLEGPPNLKAIQVNLQAGCIFSILVFVHFLILSSGKYHLLISNSMVFKSECISGPRFNIYKTSGSLTTYNALASPSIVLLCSLVYTEMKQLKKNDRDKGEDNQGKRKHN